MVYHLLGFATHIYCWPMSGKAEGAQIKMLQFDRALDQRSRQSVIVSRR